MCFRSTSSSSSSVIAMRAVPYQTTTETKTTQSSSANAATKSISIWKWISNGFCSFFLILNVYSRPVVDWQTTKKETFFEKRICDLIIMYRNLFVIFLVCFMREWLATNAHDGRITDSIFFSSLFHLYDGTKMKRAVNAPHRHKEHSSVDYTPHIDIVDYTKLI